MISLDAVQSCCFLTIDASETGSCFPVQASGPFKNLSLIVRPRQDPSLYTVTVYHDGEVYETHTYNVVGTRTVAEMQVENFIYPLNLGVESQRAFIQASRVYSGIPILVEIENLDTTTSSYEIYACYEMYTNSNVHVVTQE